MPRGNDPVNIVHYRPQPDSKTYIVVVDDLELYEKWKLDRKQDGRSSIPLVHFASSSKIQSTK